MCFFVEWVSHLRQLIERGSYISAPLVLSLPHVIGQALGYFGLRGQAERDTAFELFNGFQFLVPGLN